MDPRKIFFKVLGLAILFFVTSSFVKTDHEELEKRYTQPPAMEFKTDGLYYAEFYDYLYRGHFENITIKREDMEFLMIFEQYLRAFGRQCPGHLPADKVEIMEQVCATEEVTRNGYGVETSRVCVEWVWVGTGLYARPDLYDAKKQVENIHRAKGLQTVLAMVADPNALGNSVDLMHKANGLKNDMAQIFQLNPCASEGVKRFEENLKLYALNQPAIRMQGVSKYKAMKESGGPTGTQNLAKLFDDLVANQARTWSFNRYVPGSISYVTIESKDSKGRPAMAKANYNYKGFGGTSKGWVKITFTDGLPKCIYFFDFPQNCKTPNSSIVASYAKGAYAKQ